MQFRRRVPADIKRIANGQNVVFTLPPDTPGKPDLVVSAKLGSAEVTFSLRSRDPALVRLRHAAAYTQLEQHFQAIRTGPQWLDHKQRVAFGGLAYQDFVKSFEGFPGEPEIWELAKEAHERALSSPDRAETWFGPYVDQIALAKGLVLDAESRSGVIKEAARACIEAAARLKQNAEGDYSPDPVAARFPKWEDDRNAQHDAAKPKASAVSIHDVFNRWLKERSPAASTVSTWRGCADAFVAHLGHDDMARATKADVVAWKDALVDRGLSPKTIGGGHLATLNTLYRFAVENGLVPSNPADGVRLRVKRRAGTSMLPHTDKDVARILSLSQLEKLPYRRWIPWLLAFSGARVGEIAQLWGSRVKIVDGIPSMQIAPAEDGGSLKNAGSERTIPIHPAIVAEGFLDFVKERGSGPLFYTRRGSGAKHPSKGVSNHLSKWIRSQGFADERKAPNHAFRHYFKSACLKARLQDSLVDLIQGHKGSRGEADRYRHADLESMLEAIKRIKVPATK
jgi:integrase